MSYAAARVKINGFDFDSLEPVRGNVVDEKYEQAKKDMWHGIIMYIIAIDIVILGLWTGQWWYFGGFKYAIILIHKCTGGFMTMVQHGF